MQVFVTGASGHIGSAVVPELQAAGHQVVGLARSDASASALAAAGATVWRASLDDLDDLATAAAAADGVIHLAYRHDLSVGAGDYARAAAIDLEVVTRIGASLAESGKPFAIATGLVRAAPGQVATERDTAEAGGPNPRVASENAAVALAQRGVRSAAVRLAPTVHSSLDQHGFVPRLIDIARRKGLSAYVEDGANRWPAVHTLDAARLFRLALEVSTAGSRWHAVGDQGVPFRDIATVIGRRLNVPVVGMSNEEAALHFGSLFPFVTFDMPASSELTQQLLGWQPTQPGIIADIEEGHYFQQIPATVAT